MAKTRKYHRNKKSSKSLLNKTASGINKGVSGFFGIFKSGVNLATDSVKQGINKSKQMLSSKKKSRKMHKSKRRH